MSKYDTTDKMSWADIEAYEPSEAPTGEAVRTATNAAKSDREALADLNRQAREMRDKVALHRNAIERAIQLDRKVLAWAGRADQPDQPYHQYPD